MAEQRQRKKVESPFVLGPGEATAQIHQPDLRSRVGQMKRVSPSEGTLLVDSLLKFAGVASSHYVEASAKKVEADKAIQTARAMQGLVPTDAATVSGYRAHAAVNIKNYSLASQARLNQLSKTRATDEEWEQAIQDEYEGLDKYLMDTYDLYTTDKELQKLSANSLREIIPQVTAEREANKISFEIEDRKQSATDMLINAVKAKQLPVDEENKEGTVKFINTMFDSLKLTESQKDDIFVNATLTTRSPNLLELTKSYKGQRKATLFSRVGALHKLEKQLFDENISNIGIDLAVERRLLEKSYLDGDLLDKELISKVKIRNSKTDNKFMSPSQLDSLMDRRDKDRASDYRQRSILEDLIDPTKTDMSLYKTKEVQGALNSLYNTYLQQYENTSTDIQDETERQSYMLNKRKTAIQRVGDISIKSGTVVKSWVADLNNLANLNIPATVLEKPLEEFKIEQLSPVAQNGLEKLDSLSATAKDEYLEELGGREEKVLRNFLHFRDMELPLPQALDRAQRIARNPVPLDAKAIEKGVDKVRSSLEFSWFRPDFPDNQESYLEQLIREKIATDPNPDSERAVESAKVWANSKITVAGKLRLLGTPYELQRAMAINVDKMEDAMKAFISTQRDKIMPMLTGLNLDIDDVFPVTDPKRGTIELRTKHGDYLGMPIPLKEVRGIVNKWKVAQEKRASKQNIEHTVPWR